MLFAPDQLCWWKMYVYQTNVYKDLHTLLTEYLGECEHQGVTAECKEISMDVVDDVEAWEKKRKALLLADFAEYLNAQVD